MTERCSVSYGQQRFGFSCELDGRDMADGKDASKAGNEATLRHEPSDCARADTGRQELPPRHPAALHAGDLGDPVVDGPRHCHFCTHTQHPDAACAF
jgi:hypothetical protein